jgi:uncharacterized protein
MMTSVLTAPRGVLVEATTPVAAPETHFLDGAICWHLLGREQVGRLAVLVDGGAEVLQVAYRCREGRLFFRSAPDTEILDLTEHPRVAFEVDGLTMSASWSIVVRGTTRRLSSGSQILRSGAAALRSSRRAEKFDYFEIHPEQISGRLVPTPD